MLVRLWSRLYACPVHTKAELIKAHDVFTALRTAEVSFYKETYKNPGAVVWGAQAFSEFHYHPEQDEPIPRLPDGLPVLMIPDATSPAIFAVDEVLASVLMSIFRGRYLSKSRLAQLAKDLAKQRPIQETKSVQVTRKPDREELAKLLGQFLVLAGLGKDSDVAHSQADAVLDLLRFLDMQANVQVEIGKGTT